MKKIKYLWPLVAVIAVLLTTAGVTYAWFVRSASLATLLKIQPPDAITITPVGEDGKDLAALNLEYKEGVDSKVTNEEDGTTTITIRRPVRIESTSPVHQLEVVHTTNLNKLTFKIYLAEKNSEGTVSKTETELPLSCKNNQKTDPHLAIEQELENYDSKADVADVHAYPLYWLAKICGAKGEVPADQWESDWQEVISDTQPGLDPNTMTEKDF